MVYISPQTTLLVTTLLLIILDRRDLVRKLAALAVTLVLWVSPAHAAVDLLDYRDEAGNLIPAGQLVFPQGYWVPLETVPGRFKKVQ